MGESCAVGIWAQKKNPEDNVGDCLFQMSLVLGVLLFSYVTRSLKAVADTGTPLKELATS